jgi:hypothetical protein
MEVSFTPQSIHCPKNQKNHKKLFINQIAKYPDPEKAEIETKVLSGSPYGASVKNQLTVTIGCPMLFGSK